MGYHRVGFHGGWWVGWSDFGEKTNSGICRVVIDCHGTPNLKFHFDLLLFPLAQGLTELQTILPVSLK